MRPNFDRFAKHPKNIFLLFAMSIFPLIAVADNATDSLMRVQADAFLAHLPQGLQHRQTLAVRAAIEGNNGELEAVRHSRNAQPVISDNVAASMPTSTLRLYEPKDCDGGQLPLLIYLHGGGWTFGSLNSCARYCNAMAERGGIKVLAVDYRLAPEHPFPAGLDDCVRAVDYACSHADELGIDTLRISIGGDSSGGNFALATAFTAACKGRIASLVLFYPVTKAFADHSASWTEYGDGYGLDAELMEAFNDAYCSNVSPTDERISVGLCADSVLSELPPTLLIAAGRDILRDQGCELAERMPGRIRRIAFKEAVHLFITVPGQDAAFNRAVELSHAFVTQPRP